MKLFVIKESTVVSVGLVKIPVAEPKPAFSEQKTAQASGLNRFLWQGLLSLNGTLEEWVKKSDAEIAAIEAEIREIKELLSENTNREG